MTTDAIQREYSPFARLTTGGFAAFTYQRETLKPLVDTGVKWRDDLDNAMRDMIDDPSDGLVRWEALPEGMSADGLPELAWEDAVDVSEHAFYSGGDMQVMAIARAKGKDAMLNYAEVQGCIGMQGCPWNEAAPDDQKWIGAENLRMD
ncbi:hypothetical protein A9P79_17825 [Cupriavidus taiwanensis]|uniref:hypothetical protein n=1 Tax=Cupriavidus taiwanensis TaxID=164546 RepID=UPI001F01A3A7|nr:hypothetical protein [Cupriavidus taiwanensis]ULX53806.1 hypothetical protein A9P79_17825 [Cupriavidus taiwanensis]